MVMHLYVTVQVFRIENVGIYDSQIANSGERGRFATEQNKKQNSAKSALKYIFFLILPQIKPLK